MKKLIILIMLMLGISVFYPTFASAQGMMGNIAEENNATVSENTGHTAQGEAEGKVIWEKLQAKELNCEDLSDDDFHLLGMHFMGVMVGDSHEAMDTMMEQMMGEEGEDQMHIAMGKRMSGCEESAPIPQTMMGGGMMPMMSMMVGGGGNPMMGYGGWGGFGLGWIFMIIFWILIILGVVALVRYLGGTKQHATDKDRTPLDILKERYAKGEIDKKQFEVMKKDLS